VGELGRKAPKPLKACTLQAFALLAGTQAPGAHTPHEGMRRTKNPEDFTRIRQPQGRGQSGRRQAGM